METETNETGATHNPGKRWGKMAQLRETLRTVSLLDGENEYRHFDIHSGVPNEDAPKGGPRYLLLAISGEPQAGDTIEVVAAVDSWRKLEHAVNERLTVLARRNAGEVPS